MLNRSSRSLLLIKVRAKGMKRRIFIPMPLFILYDIIDEIESLLNVIKLFLGKNCKHNNSSKFNSVLDIILLCIKAIQNVKYTESFDLVDVYTDEVEVKISIL